MKSLMCILNKNLKYVLVMFLLLFCLLLSTSCKDPKVDEYDFEFTPSNISKEVNKTFNIFDLNFETNLPNKVKNNLKTYTQVEVTSSDENIVLITNNTITTLAKGKTEISVVINYNNEEVPSSFNLTINSSSETDLKDDTNKPNPPIEEPPTDEDNKTGKFTYTYTYEILDEEYIIYMVTICKDGTPYINYELNLTKEEIDRESSSKEPNGEYIVAVLTNKKVIIEITDLVDKTNKSELILEIKKD